MEEITRLQKFTATPFKQEIELQRVDHAAGFTTLRIRIREGKRFTIFDVDEATALHWGEALADWARSQARAGETK
ncbi:MAG: hypothetical protein M0T84_15025 [Betaproteobacteria bacterium]|nr:hypothetical protein [Betaproteobacteria bacterium]